MKSICNASHRTDVCQLALLEGGAAAAAVSGTRRNTNAQKPKLSRWTFCAFPRELSSPRRTLPIVLKELSGMRERLMIMSMPTTARPQQRYDLSLSKISTV